MPTTFLTADACLEIAVAIAALSKGALVDCYVDNVIPAELVEEGNSTSASTDADGPTGRRSLSSLQSTQLDLSACSTSQTTLEAAISVQVDSPEAYSALLSQLISTLNNQPLVETVMASRAPSAPHQCFNITGARRTAPSPLQ